MMNQRTVPGLVLLTFAGHPNSIKSLVFKADGKRIVSSCADRNIRFWDIETELQNGKDCSSVEKKLPPKLARTLFKLLAQLPIR